jgi:hypothetical protein
MNVVYIDSKVLQARYKKVSSAAETWYVSEVLRERHMVRRILKEKPDVILVGRTHALALKQALKIPSERYREPVLPEGPEARLAVHHMPATRRTPVNHWEVTQRDPNALRRLRRRIIREYRMRRFL